MKRGHNDSWLSAQMSMDPWLGHRSFKVTGSKYQYFLQNVPLWKIVAENNTENFATLKITLKNNIKENFTENYTEKRPLLFRNAKKRLTYQIFIQTKYHFKSQAIH